MLNAVLGAELAGSKNVRPGFLPRTVTATEDGASGADSDSEDSADRSSRCDAVAAVPATDASQALMVAAVSEALAMNVAPRAAGSSCEFSAGAGAGRARRWPEGGARRQEHGSRKHGRRGHVGGSGGGMR